MQLDLEYKQSGKNCTAQLIYPKRNGTAQYLAVSTHALGPVHRFVYSVLMLLTLCIINRSNIIVNQSVYFHRAMPLLLEVMGKW